MKCKCYHPPVKVNNLVVLNWSRARQRGSSEPVDVPLKLSDVLEERSLQEGAGRKFLSTFCQRLNCFSGWGCFSHCPARWNWCLLSLTVSGGGSDTLEGVASSLHSPVSGALLKGTSVVLWSCPSTVFCLPWGLNPEPSTAHSPPVLSCAHFYRHNFTFLWFWYYRHVLMF